MHLVHMNSKYENLTEAFNHGDGVAVLALLYEVKHYFSIFKVIKKSSGF